LSNTFLLKLSTVSPPFNFGVGLSGDVTALETSGLDKDVLRSASGRVDFGAFLRDSEKK